MRSFLGNRVLLRLRQTQVVDDLVARFGPAVRRVPRHVRREATRQSDIPRIAARTWELGPAEHVRGLTPAESRRQSRPVRPLATKARVLPPPFVSELRDPWLVGRHATPITNERRMLLTPFRDHLPLVGLETNDDLAAWLSSREAFERLPPLQGAACSLVGRFDINYFHWMVDTCGLIEGADAYAQLTGEAPRLVVRAQAPRFVRESLELLGVDRDRIVEWPVAWGAVQSGPPWPAQKVERLVVPSWRGYRAGSSPSSLRWLRRRFLESSRRDAGASGEVQPRVYVHRSAQGWRGIENEDAVLGFMREEGFAVVRPEELTLPGQIDVFSRATTIVGMHGAGLTNVLFSPGARVIELIGSYGGEEYFSIAKGLGNPYTRVACQDAGDNILVDLSALAAALRDVSDSVF